MPSIKLFEFPMSHYCEKVRWALEYKQLPYERKLLLPVLHMPVMLALTRQTQVPVIECNGDRIANSPAILAFLEEQFPDTERLYPQSEDEQKQALELCAMFDKEIGPHVRRIAYYFALSDKAFMQELLSLEQPFVNRKVLAASMPVITRLMRKGMGVNEDGYQKSLARLNTLLTKLDAMIKPSGYLVGDHFTIADLTAAALLAPIVQPQNSFYALPTQSPDAFKAFNESYRQRPFFAWVEEIYRKHR